MARRSCTAPPDRALSRALQVLGAPGEEPALREEFARLTEAYEAQRHKLYKTLSISDTYQAEIKELVLRLEESMKRFEQLREMSLPICVRCRKVRVDDDYWQRLESYMAKNLDVMFSHGLCPDCVSATCRGLGESVTKRELPEPLSARDPHTRVRHAQAPEDPQVMAAKALALRLTSENPALGEELRLFAERFAKLSRRFHKILSISDSYQTQLQNLNSRLELMARTDLLTGLPNRWEMTNRLEMERSRAERHGTSFCVVLGDLDHFKLINDTFGHQAGDTVLRRVGAALRAALRTEDLCARWGGEEFLVLLPHTELAQAVAVAEKLRSVVAKLDFSWDAVAVKVSVSFGAAQYRPEQGVDDCLKRADDALYLAKDRGRDQVAASQD